MGGSAPQLPKGIGGFARQASILNPAAWPVAGYDALSRGLTDPGGAKNAASNAKTASSEQAAQAAALETLTLQQPKQISPDNFLATKTNALANLRLGLASTMTGAGGAPSAVLSAPSLTAGGSGKTKLGS